MNGSKRPDGNIQIVLSDRELDVIFRCLNEICHGVRFRLGDEGEFETRIGVHETRVQKMLNEIIDISRSADG